MLVNVTRLPRGRELVFREGMLQEFLPQAVLGPSGVPSLRTHLVSTAYSYPSNVQYSFLSECASTSVLPRGLGPLPRATR